MLLLGDTSNTFRLAKPAFFRYEEGWFFQPKFSTLPKKTFYVLLALDLALIVSLKEICQSDHQFDPKHSNKTEIHPWLHT